MELRVRLHEERGHLEASSDFLRGGEERGQGRLVQNRWEGAMVVAVMVVVVMVVVWEAVRVALAARAARICRCN